MANNYKTVKSQVGTSTYTWTVPDGVAAKLKWLHCSYVASAAAGTRQVAMTIKDAFDTSVADFSVGATFTADQDRHFLFSTGIYRETSFVNNELQCPFPVDIVLEPGWTMTISAVAGGDAGDAQSINFQYEDLS